MKNHALSTCPQTHLAQGRALSHTIRVEMMSLSELAYYCQEAITHYRNGEEFEASYGYELFLRALVEKDEQAWALVYELYQPLVIYWIEHTPSFAMTDEDGSYFVNRAFEKMWNSVAPEKFSQFPDLKSLLQYFKMCVKSILIDHIRAQKYVALVAYEETIKKAGWNNQILEPTSQGIDETILNEIHSNEVWQQIEMRLTSERERLVMYGSYILALKPRELYAEYPGEFVSVNQIYRIKQNILARLRRDTALLEELGCE